MLQNPRAALIFTVGTVNSPARAVKTGRITVAQTAYLALLLLATCNFTLSSMIPALKLISKQLGKFNIQ